MGTPFNGGACLNLASLSTERKLKVSGSEKTIQSENTANNASDNCIACTKEDKSMQTDLECTLTYEDVQYIRNQIAEGIARMLVGKVAKSSDLAVDNSEPEQYNSTPKKGGTAT